VDFELTEEERELGEGIRALCEGRFPLAVVRTAEGAADVVDRSRWAELGDAGVFSMLVAEADGGLGLGLGHAAVVFEELGRALVPGPLVSQALSARFVPGADDGTVVVGAARRPDPSGPTLVDHLASLDALVVVDERGLSDSPSPRVLVELVDPAPEGREVVRDGLDPLTPVWITDQVPEGQPLSGGEEAAQRWRREEQVLTGALCVGMAAATLDLAVAYAKERQQFGRVIGSFQAVKHLCADMLVRAEGARAAVHAAAVTSDQPEVGDPDRAAAGSALVATGAAIANAKTAVQVHGGMGFTWEVPVHLYLMRARMLAASIASGPTLAAEVAARY
jgi:alkylation response protein AidB-like acyl-CoA dehydrogenase